MNAAVFCYSRTGIQTAKRVSRALHDAELALYTLARLEEPGFLPIDKSVYALEFSRRDALIFVGACGIAVREIAPYVRDKKTDPAVLVLDERARHVIPLLSGHIGGAKRYNTDVADTEQLLRIIQSIPSPKAEPFKLWLAQVGRERIEETIDPELTIDRALETYLKKGYSREWINQRLQAIQVRKELTDEWDARGVQKGVEYAILTDEITKAWSGMNTRQYKNLKGLKKENLRDTSFLPAP